MQGYTISNPGCTAATVRTYASIICAYATHPDPLYPPVWVPFYSFQTSASFHIGVLGRYLVSPGDVSTPGSFDISLCANRALMYGYLDWRAEFESIPSFY